MPRLTSPWTPHFADPKLYIFDADGTLRRCTVPGQPCPHDDGEWELFPEVRPRLARLHYPEVLVGIASNQAGISHGYLTRDTAHELLRDTLQLSLNLTDLELQAIPKDAIQLCPHRPEDGCFCRKPNPGMLLTICRTYAVRPNQAIYIGDRPEDLIAATNAGIPFAWAHCFFDRKPTHGA